MRKWEGEKGPPKIWHGVPKGLIRPCVTRHQNNYAGANKMKSLFMAGSWRDRLYRKFQVTSLACLLIFSTLLHTITYLFATLILPTDIDLCLQGLSCDKQ